MFEIIAHETDEIIDETPILAVAHEKAKEYYRLRRFNGDNLPVQIVEIETEEVIAEYSKYFGFNTQW